MKMNNEQKPKAPASIVSIACSALNTEIITTTSTTTTPTTSAVPQTSVQKSSPPAASAAPRSSLPRASASSSSSSSSSTAAAGKSASLASNHSSPMSDAAAAGQQKSNSDSNEAIVAALLKKDAPISTIANINNAASSPTFASANSTPKVVATEVTSNSTSSNTNADKSKKTELWEGCGLKDWDDSSLKNLLEEAYSYKTPRDKENKSEYFLQLLQNAENEKEDQTFAFRAIASRYTRNSATATASNSHKQGGSLQDLVEAVRNESLLDGDYQIGVGGQRNRRLNHNSRQKKYSSVSSRQREGGSLPSNVNVTYCGGSSLLGSALDQQTAPAFMHDVVAKSNTGSSKQQRRNKANERTVAASLAVDKDFDSAAVSNSNSESVASTIAAGASGGVAVVGAGAGGSSSGAAATNCVAGGGDCVIEMGEPMMDIQQQQQILQAKGHDAATQGLPYYDRLDSIDMRIPRANVISSLQTKTDFAPTSSQCYVDEAVRFTTLERGGGSTGASTGSGVCTTACGQNKVSSSTIDTKYLPLDENYKSCKSVLGEKSDLIKTPSTMFSTTKTITRQFDEEIYQQSAAAAIFNASTTGGHSSTVSQSQAKAKNKKKSQQERNTKTVDVKSVAGYRGNDPVEVLVKYIESSEDKQNDKSTSNSNKFNENTKKRERKKDKEKQHKMKKSNSLEELRSCAKIDVDELKTSAATTESNVMMRNKSGKNKNNSASAADINKNYDTKELTTTTTTSSKALAIASPTATTATAAAATTVVAGNNNQRKGERRSWGTEELQYLGESNCNEEKTMVAKEKRNKDKNKDHAEKEEKSKESTKEKSIEKQDKNSNIIETSATATITANGANKLDKTEKRKKSEGNLHATLTTTTSNTLNNDYNQAMDAALLPEAAEFHVVTKKKKPKKQRASLDETNSSSSYTAGIGGFNRSSNFMYNMQKSGAYANGPQRYKYYNQHATNNDYLHNYNNNAASNNNNQHVADKSRRKSTSSMPPSEKSDSSDLDSVHSLPIESTTTTTTTGITKNKQRHKNANAQTTTAAGAPASNKAAAASNSPAPISYADIARTNKELQLTPTSTTAAVAGDKWPAVDYINNNIQTQSNVATATESTIENNNVEPAAVNAQSVAPAQPNTVVKHKTKKSNNKPDFPELVATLTSPTNAATSAQIETTKPTNSKQISYSQSLAAVPVAAAVMTNSNDDVAADIAVLKEKPEKRFVAAAAANSETELANLALNSNMTPSYKPQQQSHQQQQQPLQKSKSVEHESYNYNYNYNGSNMDQQYPALEKTVKRHSAATVIVSSGLASLNLAAAGSKQSNNSNIINSNNDDNALAPSTPTANKIATATATSPNSQTNETIVSIPAVKKSKEKTSVQNVLLTSESSIANSNSVAATTTSVARKSKKEKPQQLNEITPSKSTTTATQTATAYVNNINRSNSNATTFVETNTNNNKKSHSNNNSTHTKTHNKTHSLSKHSSTSSGGGSAASSTTATNRPAVIILNDDRSGGYTASNEFTFGDFNEEELKFFDDEIVTSSAETIDDEDDYDEEHEEDVDAEAEININAAAEYATCGDNENLSNATANESTKQAATMQQRKTSPAVAPTQRIFFNDSGTNFNTTSTSSSSSASDIGACVLNNSVQHGDELILLSAADSSSPNTSVLVGANQSSDSGIYTSNKVKNSGEHKRLIAKNDVAECNSHTTDSTATNKLNAFLNNSCEQINANNLVSSNSSSSITTTNRSKQTMPANGNSSSSSSSRATIKQSRGNVALPPPQQLETCNEIESAIIAAARAAAAVEQNQQQQQQQQPNFNSSSASSSFSSSSSVSIESKYSSYQSQQPQQNHYHRHHQHQHQHHHHHHHHNRHYSQQTDDAESQHTRSRSNSSQRDVAAVVSNVQHKELDLNFISPTMSSLQHNEIIIDFIGSAWEEVAKVTKFYDGQ